MKRLALVLLFLPLWPLRVTQEVEPDSQTGDLIFHMPPGWNRVERADLTLLVAPITAPTSAYIALLPASELKSDLRTSFNAAFDIFKSNYQVLEGPEVAPWHSPKGYDAMTGIAVLVDRNKARWVLFLMMAQNGTRAETLFFISNVVDPGLNSTLQRVFQNFLSSLGFANGAGDKRVAEAAKPLPVPKSQGKFNGIYRAVGVIHYSATGLPNIGYTYVVFFPDGRFMEGFPDLGMDKLDEDAEIRRNPIGWGTYQLSSDRGKIVFPPDENSKNPVIWDLKEYSDSLTVNGDKYTLLERCDGLKLQGTFRREGYQSLYPGSRQGITFTPDGQFADEGVFKAAAVMVRHPVGIGDDFDDGAPGRGIYRIVNYTIELAYSSGRTKRTSIFMEPGASKTNVREFYLNTYKFIRVP